MSLFTWSSRRQLAVFAIFAMVVLLIVLGAIYYFRPEPTCFDKRQNQDEEGVDCGGAVARCAPCSEKIHDLTILWTRLFLIKDGFYDVVSLLENGNQFLKTDKFVYAIKLYDENGVLLAARENSTFIAPGEKVVILEPNVQTQNRSPKTVILEMRGVNWKSGEAVPIKIDVLRKDVFLTDALNPRLEVRLKNQSASVIYKNIEASAILLEEGGAVLGGSRTMIDKLDIFEEKTIIFTWPRAIEGVLRADIFLRQAP